MATPEDRDAEGSAETEDKAEAWESFEPEVYHEVAKKLVHHSFKTVNSNITAGGVRLGPEAALPLPYVSARTLLAHGIELDLDYIANAGKTAKVVKQIRAVRRALPMAAQASDTERAAITAAMTLARSGVEIGTDRVDLRMRQILVPCADSYVVLTPLTASGLGSVLFDKALGLVTQHNADYAAEIKASKGATADTDAAVASSPLIEDGTQPHGSARDSASVTRRLVHKRRIRRAYLGVGGSNPQNVGALVRALQRPLFVPGPVGQQGPRAAFALYHRGFELPSLRELLMDLRRHRESLRSGNALDTTMDARDEERRLVFRIARQMIAAGRDALGALQAHADVLPREHLIDTADPAAGYELLSRAIRVRGLRGLVDPRLREDDWPARIAETVMRHMETHSLRLGDRPEPILLLDAPARASMRRQLEEAFAEDGR
jgi:hypothetical protein